MKRCSRCRRELPIEQFSSAGGSKRQNYCKECVSEYMRARYRAKRDETLMYARNYRLELRADILAAYGNCCACCGENEEAFLVVDHVNDDGYLEGKDRCGMSFYQRVRREGYPFKYQVLCFNCNAAKSTRGRCPHQVEEKAS